MVSNGSRKPDVQHAAYRAFFDTAPAPSEVQLFRKGSPADPRMVGDPEFIRRMHQSLGLAPARPKPPVPNTADLPRIIPDILECLTGLCLEHLPPRKRKQWARLGTLENLRSRSRRPPLPMLRALIASHLITSKRYRLKDIQTFFELRPRTLSAARRRAYQLQFDTLLGHPAECHLQKLPGANRT
jgi:hypothetical protein